MDIRKFFSPVNSKKKDAPQNEKKRKKNIIEDSDDEDPLPKSLKKSQVLASDSDEDDIIFIGKKKSPVKSQSKGSHQKLSKNSSKSKPDVSMKAASAKDFFGSSKVQRIEAKSKATKNEKPEEKDKAFEETLKELDDNGNFTKDTKKKRKISDDETDNNEKDSKIMGQKNIKSSSKKHKKENSSGSNKDAKADGKKERTPKKELNGRHREKSKSPVKKEINSPVKNKTPVKSIDSSKHKEKVKNEAPQNNGKVESKSPKSIKIVKENKNKHLEIEYKTPNKAVIKEEKNSDLEKSSINESISNQSSDNLNNSSFMPETPEEKRAHKAMAYKKFLQRAGPKNPGVKQVPECSSDCLKGLTFVISGVLESFDREEMASTIKEKGGKVTTSISKNTSYVLVGDEPGESKMKKAESLGTKILSEDEILQLMVSKTKTANGSSSPKKSIKKHDKDENSNNAYLIKPEVKSSKKEKSDKYTKELEKIKEPSKKLKPVSPEKKSFPSSPSSTTSSLSQTSLPSPKIKSEPEFSQLWVDKYKPSSLKAIIGQQGDASNAKKLLNWLKNWSRNQSGKVKLTKPSPWSKDNTGSYFKAALLSGPPGVGKTTTVGIVCKELGFSTVELNASDTRSKRSMQEEVSNLLSNKSLSAMGQEQKMSQKHALVMDEVDGMAGNEDRGGMQELIALIKSSKVPIICMCNDRNSQKIRSLANYCFDLRFYKPRVEQIRGAMMSICFKEGIKIKPQALDEVIIGSNQDIRQVLNHLSVWSSNNKNMDTKEIEKAAKSAKKDLKIGPFDVCAKVFSEASHATMSFQDKINLFFNDYSLSPLFVQENYPKAIPKCARGNPKKLMDQMAKAAQAISDGDLVDKCIRSNNSWSLLPVQAFYSSLLPGKYLSGNLGAQIEFPKWLGNFSRQKKFDRISQELHTHMILRISGSKRDITFDYAKSLRDTVLYSLSEGSDGVNDAVNLMTSHDLVREDLDSIVELAGWPGSKDIMSSVESKVKAAFTRAINKSSHLNPYGASNISKKKGKVSLNEEGEEEEDEEDDDIDDDFTKDAMISMSKKNTKAKSSKAGSSKDNKPSNRGKGKK